MNVLRGGNEQGKSSLLTGIAYNWFGSMALPQSVDDTVTWGTKKTSLKTKTNFTIAPYHYTCHRSASGAELYRNDKEAPLVTGHKEVSSAVATLFDLPNVATATKLQIASQNDVRGVISLGATAAAAFIEELIDMKEIDDMIKDVSGKLVYSSDAKKQTVTAADTAAEQLKATAKPVSTKKLEKECALLLEKVSKLEPEVASTREAVLDISHALKNCLSQQNVQATQHKALKIKIEQLEPKLAVPTDSITQEEVEEAASLLSKNTIYSFYMNEFLPFEKTKPEATWEGTEASLDLYIKGLEDQQSKLRELTTDMKVELAETKAGIVTDTNCPTCGQEICDANEVAEKNTLLQEKILLIEDELVVVKDDFAEGSELLKEANRLVAFQQKQSLWLAKRPSVETVDSGVVPSKIAMVGGNPEKPARVVTQIDFNKLHTARTKQVEAEAVYDENLALHKELEKQEADLRVKISDQSVARLKLESDKAGAEEIYQLTLANYNSAVAEHSEVNNTVAKIKVTNESITTMRENLKNDIAKWRKSAEEIQENSDLISALRSARLDISSLLWQKLLGVTENYFSLFRGKPSTLSMSKKGILVDGHLSAPSGSTLDVLGLALRLAMSKLFANNGLCILDEPASGCDDDRTAAMTAGLLSSGFEQVILVTHKDVDESAGNLILI